MALAPSSNPLNIIGIVRKHGKVTARISGHGFTSGAHVGQPIRVSGVADSSYNGTFTVSAVPDANTLQWLQSGVIDNGAELSGGAISVG